MLFFICFHNECYTENGILSSSFSSLYSSPSHAHVADYSYSFPPYFHQLHVITSIKLFLGLPLLRLLSYFTYLLGYIFIVFSQYIQTISIYFLSFFRLCSLHINFLSYIHSQFLSILVTSHIRLRFSAPHPSVTRNFHFYLLFFY